MKVLRVAFTGASTPQNRTYLLIKNGARNNGAGDSNTKNLKVHNDVPYPQGKIKICEKTWI
jgi:hypothetical protein